MEQLATLNQLSTQQCVVNLAPKVNRNDFVFVRDEQTSRPRVARIEEIFGTGLAHVTWYLSADELIEYDVKLESENGLKIQIQQNELIENGLESKNIALDKICGKCTVLKAHENESVTVVLQRIQRKSQMAYVCRYKLVKSTSYKLVPVGWLPGEEDLRNSGDITDSDFYTDSEDHMEAVINLSTTINQLHLSLTKTDKKPKDVTQQLDKLVSPIKIVNKEVKRLTRTKSASNVKRTSPDADKQNNDVSPSKRNKLINNLNNAFESPVSGRSRRHLSPAQTSVKKNLNDSFSDSFSGRPESPYQSKIDNEQPLKMIIEKKSRAAAVLKELHNNTESSPMKIDTPAERAINRRKSILKGPDSAKRDTPRRSVVINAELKNENKQSMDVVATPRRQSSRISMSKTRDAMKSVAIHETSPELERPRSTRKSIIKPMSPPSTPKSASKRSAVPRTPKTSATPKTVSTPNTMKTPKSVMTPQQSRSLYRSGNLTPSIQSRQESISGEQTELEKIRERLQVSAVPTSLPCREKEYASIYEFVTGKLSDGSSGCIYISGVPGTGKTATVTQVIKTIQKELKPKKLPAFDYVEINGMRLTEPRQAYVQIYRQLTGKTMAWAQARDLLETRFTAGSKKAIRPTVLLVDELDIICNRKQDVVYNLFDWTVRKGARLIAITIANTMDLPERVLKLKVASRLGLTRITFQPYAFKQLQEVVMTRLAGSNCFMADAVQLVARKVASVSGDCRRALDICRRATEIAEEKKTGDGPVEVNFAHINQALTEMFASPKVRAIKNCTKFEKLFLQAVASEITRTGIEEVEFHRVHWQIGTLAPVLGIKNPPTEDQSMQICMTLAANRLLIAEDSSTGLYQKIILNATVDDLYYALNVS